MREQQSGRVLKAGVTMAKRILHRALTLMLVCAAAAQSNNPLVGTWKLISVRGTNSQGEVIQSPFGANPTGFLTYTADGRMMVIITNGGRKPLSVNDRVSASAVERAEAFATMLAYAGRYTFAGETVTHHVEAASFQNWVKTDLVRHVKIEGKRLTLRRPPGGAAGGVELGDTDLLWERIE